MLVRVKQAILISFIIITFNCGCALPEAIKTQIGGIETRMNKFEKIAENLNVEFTKIIQAETVNYNGAPWVIVGMSAVLLIFLFAIYFVGKSLLKHKSMLHLVTCAVNKASPVTKQAVKQQIELEVENGGSFKEQHKKDLADFAFKKGTFAK